MDVETHVTEADMEDPEKMLFSCFCFLSSLSDSAGSFLLDFYFHLSPSKASTTYSFISQF